MEITRYLMDGLTMSKDGETDKTAIVITLTEEEILTAYREQKHKFRLLDAEMQLAEYLGFDPGDKDPYSENSAAVGEFAGNNGYWPWELVDENSPHYALESIVGKFLGCHDCNVSENDLFQSICEEVIEELKEVKP